MSRSAHLYTRRCHQHELSRGSEVTRLYIAIQMASVSVSTSLFSLGNEFQMSMREELVFWKSSFGCCFCLVVFRASKAIDTVYLHTKWSPWLKLYNLAMPDTLVLSFNLGFGKQSHCPCYINLYLEIPSTLSKLIHVFVVDRALLKSNIYLSVSPWQ